MGRPRLRRYQVDCWYNQTVPYLIAAKDEDDARRQAIAAFKHEKKIKKFVQLDVEEIKPEDPRYR